jgi:hypothetical protein
MSYTVLRVVDRGVTLYEAHEARFVPAGPAAVAAYCAFAAEARPGVYSLRWADDHLEAVLRDKISLFDGIPVRYVPSPLSASDGLVPKAPPPNEYAGVRTAGVATLLTSPDGVEIFESCTASVVAWDDGFVAPPPDRPRLLSTTTTTLLQQASVHAAPLLKRSRLPLALINAVSGLVVPSLPDRDPWPAEARTLFDRVWTESTRRP